MAGVIKEKADQFKCSPAYGAFLASKRWLNKTEAALYLECSEITLNNCRQFISETRFSDGKPLFDRVEIDAFLESRKVK